MATGAALNACGGASVIEIPASLIGPCVSSVDVSTAQTVGDLGRAVIIGDADLAICSARKDAVVTIAEAGKKRWWVF